MIEHKIILTESELNEIFFELFIWAREHKTKLIKASAKILREYAEYRTRKIMYIGENDEEV